MADEQRLGKGVTVMEVPKMLEEIAEACGGEIKEVGLLPDNSGFATMSMPLRKDHWIYGDKEFADQYEPPPMVFKQGSGEVAQLAIGDNSQQMTREQFAEQIRKAGRYAVRSATMQGKEMDFDPDALLQNLVVGFLGYWTENGLTGTDDDWANPPKFRQPKSEHP